MILYYTGTGNSAYAACRIAADIGDEAVNLFPRLRDGDTSTIESQKPWIIVTPTYAWRVPRIVRDWLDKTELRGAREIYFVMTCGSEIGNAGSYAEKWCRGKGFDFKGCAGAFRHARGSLAERFTHLRHGARTIRLRHGCVH